MHQGASSNPGHYTTPEDFAAAEVALEDLEGLITSALETLSTVHFPVRGTGLGRGTSRTMREPAAERSPVREVLNIALPSAVGLLSYAVMQAVDCALLGALLHRGPGRRGPSRPLRSGP